MTSIALALVSLLAGAEDTFLLRNVTVHPVSGPEVANTMVLVKDGKIAAIGPKLVERNAKIVDGKGGHVWPGMINSATEIGLREISSIRETVDTGELGAFNPQLRALIAVNPESEFIPVTRANGITAAVTMPSPGTSGYSPRSAGPSPIIPGQVSVIHLDGWTWEEMEVKRSAAMQLLFPTIETRTFGFFEMSPGRTPFAEARKYYEGRLKEVNDYFERARAYRKAKAANASNFTTDLGLEAMIPVLDGKLPLMILASDERTIKAAIEFADKQGVKAILANVRNPGAQAAEIAKRKIPVILAESSALPEEEDDSYDKNYALPGELHKAGIKFCFGTFDTQFARNLPFEAGFSAGYGLPHDVAVKSVTLWPAEIWGLSAEYGSIEPGKWADLILTDGDLLEHRTKVLSMWIKGKPVSLENKHTRLYQKYSSRPVE